MKTMNIKKYMLVLLVAGFAGFAFAPAPERITVKVLTPWSFLARNGRGVYEKQLRYHHSGNGWRFGLVSRP
jgi:hypothetical protein